MVSVCLSVFLVCEENPLAVFVLHVMGVVTGAAGHRDRAAGVWLEAAVPTQGVKGGWSPAEGTSFGV